MSKIDVSEILKKKQIAVMDFGTVTIVRPTGRYIDATGSDFVEQRFSFLVEVRGLGMWASKRWVPLSHIKVIEEAA